LALFFVFSFEVVFWVLQTHALMVTTFDILIIKQHYFLPINQSIDTLYVLHMA